MVGTWVVFGSQKVGNDAEREHDVETAREQSGLSRTLGPSRMSGIVARVGVGGDIGRCGLLQLYGQLQKPQQHATGHHLPLPGLHINSCFYVKVNLL